MNEIIFFIQTLIIFAFAIGAWKLGKEALTAWVTIQAIVANLFVVKQITLFGFNVTPSDAYMIGSLVGLNFLQEFYDKESAQKATWICFFSMTFFVIVSQVHLFFGPSAFDTSQASFERILAPAFRLTIASMSVFFVVQQIDIRFFSFLKSRFPELSFASRSVISLILSQFFDTVLFSFAGLYGTVASILDVIIVSFAIKIITILVGSYFIRLAKTSQVQQ